MVVGRSDLAHQAAADALPMRDAFAVLFFVAVGMLFDPGFVVRQPLPVLAALGCVLVAKPVVAALVPAAPRPDAAHRVLGERRHRAGERVLVRARGPGDHAEHLAAGRPRPRAGERARQHRREPAAVPQRARAVALARRPPAVRPPATRALRRTHRAAPGGRRRPRPARRSGRPRPGGQRARQVPRGAAGAVRGDRPRSRAGGTAPRRRRGGALRRRQQPCCSTAPRSSAPARWCSPRPTP